MMVEHGKCASGSSSGFCGANAVRLEAICLPPQSGATRFVLFWRASIADGLDIANLENGVVSVWDRSPPHDHLMPQVFGEAFRGEAIRLQIRENYQCSGAHQDVAAFLFMHATPFNNPPRGAVSVFFFCVSCSLF